MKERMGELGCRAERKDGGGNWPFGGGEGSGGRHSGDGVEAPGKQASLRQWEFSWPCAP